MGKKCVKSVAIGEIAESKYVFFKLLQKEKRKGTKRSMYIFLIRSAAYIMNFTHLLELSREQTAS